MITDTLKQAAQALRDTKPGLAAALEAMAEMQPVAWMATRLHSVVIAAKREDLFAFGQQQHISPLYAAPIATPEHDAKVRDAVLEEVIAALTNERVISPINGITHVYNSAIDASMEVVRALKTSTGEGK